MLRAGWRLWGQAISLVALALAVGMVIASAQESRLPREVEAVRKHILEKDYPERFGSTSYRTKIENVLVTDLDRDGSPEVVVLFVPHYRQSAPIVIYRVAKDLQVTRVAEGLAPGPLVALSGAYLDSHTAGQAADFTVESKDKPIDHDQMRQAVFKSGFGGIVEYKTFFHADGRSGQRAYVDMTHVALPRGRDNCNDFEFSRVDEIATGALSSEPNQVHLAARVGSELWLYHVEAFLPNGLMRKTFTVEKTPEDFVRFVAGRGHILMYQTRSGELRPVRRRGP